MQAKIDMHGNLSILRGSKWKEQTCGDKTCNDECPNFIDGLKVSKIMIEIEINCGAKPIPLMVVEDERE